MILKSLQPCQHYKLKHGCLRRLEKQKTGNKKGYRSSLFRLSS
jgi:hypothetical protein